MSARRLEKRPNNSGGPAGEVSVPKKKRETISTACTACQKRKSKCDGGKPTCSLCSHKATHCEYPDDSRRTVNLRAQNQKLTAQVASYETLISLLRQSSPYNAQIIDQALANSSALGENELEQNTVLDVGSQSDSLAETTTPTMDGFIPLVEGWQLGSANSAAPGSQSSVQGFGFDDVVPRANMDVKRKMSSGGEFEDPFGFGFVSRPQNIDSTFASAPVLRETAQSFLSGASVLRGVANRLESRTVRSIETMKIWQAQQKREVALPPHILLPLSTVNDQGDNSFSDQYGRVYAAFQKQKREELGVGGKLQPDFIGFNTVDGGAMVSAESLSKTDTLSAFVFRLVRTFHNDNATILAFMHMRYRLMQWLVRPSEETYSKVPNIMRPIPEQVCFRHPCWIDFHPVPALRKAFINHPDLMNRDWLSVISTCQGSGRWTPSPMFQQHIDDPNVWTMQTSALNLIPELSGQVNLREV